MYYFDNAATTRPEASVLDTHMQVAQDYFANPSSIHLLGHRSKELLDQARQQLADLLAYKPEEIFFTSSGTESNNWLLTAILEALSQVHPTRKQVILSGIEHSSIYKQIPRLEARGFELSLAPVTSTGHLDMEALADMINDQVLLVSTIGVNNEIGSLQPLGQIADLLADLPQIAWHVDATQAVTACLDQVKLPRIDLLTFSAHKFHGLRGTGILAKRQRIPGQSLLMGGGQEQSLRSSTENLPGIVSTAKALRLAQEHQASHSLEAYQEAIVAALNELGWTTFMEGPHSSHIICAALPPIPGEVLVHALEAYEIYVSTTSACASKSHNTHATLHAMGVDRRLSESAIRISMSYDTHQDQVEYLIHYLGHITQQFKQGGLECVKS